VQVQESKEQLYLELSNKENTLKNVIVHVILENYQMSMAREIINILPVGVLRK